MHKASLQHIKPQLLRHSFDVGSTDAINKTQVIFSI